jgi:hypothetical protein
VAGAALATACVVATAATGALDGKGADYVILQDGTIWSGRVLEVRDGAYLLRTPSGEEVRAPLDRVAEVRLGAPLRPAPAPATTSASGSGAPPHVGIDLSTAGVALRLAWDLDHRSVDTAGVRAGVLTGLVFDSSGSAVGGVGGQASFFVNFAPGKTVHLEALVGPGLMGLRDPHPFWHTGFALLFGRTTRGGALRLGFTGGLFFPAQESYLLFAPDFGFTAVW